MDQEMLIALVAKVANTSSRARPLGARARARIGFAASSDTVHPAGSRRLVWRDGDGRIISPRA